MNPKRSGYDGEHALELRLRERGWIAIRRPSGHKGDDFITAVDPKGRTWSIEVKNTMGLPHAYYKQCRDNAKGKRRLLAWHPKRWGYRDGEFVVFTWDKADHEVHLWRPPRREEKA